MPTNAWRRAGWLQRARRRAWISGMPSAHSKAISPSASAADLGAGVEVISTPPCICYMENH